MEIISKELLEEYRNISNRKCIISDILDKKIRADIYPRLQNYGQYSGISYITDNEVSYEYYYYNEVNSLSFPIKLLFMTEDELNVYVKERKAEEIKKKIADQIEYNNKKEQEEKAEYLKLKERFEK